MPENDLLREPNFERRLDILKDVPERSLAAAEQGRARFLAQARIMRASLSPRISLIERFRSYLGSLRPLPALSWVVAVVVALVMFFGGSTATVYASQASLPGDTLYPLKLFTEDSRMFWSITPAAKMNLSLDLADRRLEEISALQKTGRPIPSQVVDRLLAELDQTLFIASRMNDPQMNQALKLVATRVNGELKSLDALFAGKTVPPAVANIHASLLQLEADANLGQSDPLAFREMIQTKIYEAATRPTKTPTFTPTSTATSTSTQTFTPSTTPTASATPSATWTPTSSATWTPTSTDTPTSTKTVRTRKPTHTPKPRPNPRGYY